MLHPTLPAFSAPLLANLPADDRAYLQAIGQPEHSPAGRILRRGGEPEGSVWFPLTAVVALTATDNHGRAVHTGLVGCEGCIGAESLFTPRIPMPDALVQLSGTFLVIPALRLASALPQRPAILSALLRAAHTLSRQSMLNVICNRIHSLTARCCRWLLAMRDTTASSDLAMTQESLSLLLCSSRPRTNQLLSDLHRNGLIDRRRGHIQLALPTALQDLACGCYSASGHCKARILPPLPP